MKFAGPIWDQAYGHASDARACLEGNPDEHKRRIATCPPEFDYVRANSVQEVVALLQECEDAKLLAGATA